MIVLAQEKLINECDPHKDLDICKTNFLCTKVGYRESFDTVSKSLHQSQQVEMIYDTTKVFNVIVLHRNKTTNSECNP